MLGGLDIVIIKCEAQPLMVVDKANIAGTVRIDKWLWAARFFKTRALATQAINGGHILINGLRAKSSRVLKIGDEIVIRKGIYTYSVLVQGLSDKRGSACDAMRLYEESTASRLAREQLSEQRRLNADHLVPSKRPDKRSRRQLIKLMGKD